MKLTDTRQMMADAKFFEAYSRYNSTPADFLAGTAGYESWETSVKRVMDMHRTKYAAEMTPELEEMIAFAQKAYTEKRVLGAQRALQFGGDQILKHNAKMYNCTVSHCNRPEFFGEAMHMLLCGAGVGFSVQSHHVEQIPPLKARGKRAKTYVVDDSIEGWANSIDVLISSFMSEGAKHPEYSGCHISFDLSNIRPRGSFISGGFKAPGAAPLRKALDLVEALLVPVALAGRKLKPIEAYDITMYAADAVISGGVRRSATICLFDVTDEEMMNSKTGDWFNSNPQRGRSNNSAVILRDEITWEEFEPIMEKIKDFGEPGFIFTDNKEFAYNPCVEIGMLPTLDEDTDGIPAGTPGWQCCNLAEMNGGLITSLEDFRIAARAGAIVCTLQAGYTDFAFQTPATRAIVEREALIGVSITGWMNNPEVLFNEENMKECAELVQAVNKEVAAIIGINPAARTTCVKPSGNASVLLGTASGIHGEHSPNYLRHIQLGKDTEVGKLLAEVNPAMCEDSVWTDAYCVGFPIVAPATSIYKEDLYGIEQLEYVKKAQQVWVEHGTDVELGVHPKLRHNVSNTISVQDGTWGEVAEYVFENRFYFAGISFLGASGDKDYAQAPNAQVYTEEQLVEMYGAASFFASGLIVDGIDAFNGDLWDACAAVLWNREIPVDKTTVLQIDWVRRFKKFASNYFDGDQVKASYCLKDVQYFHKWTKIQNTLASIDWINDLGQKEYTEVDTMAAVACSGVKGCEI